ncbi:MAG: phospholipase D family protein [Armatimonadetes bacterium]|nr:phospholipase D family protein [Armatimonadota bacterium]
MRFIWRDLGLGIRDLVARAASRVIFVSPYITESALGDLVRSLPGGVRLCVFTRWDPYDIAFGAADTRILELVLQHGGILRLHPRLHAKLYVIDDEFALIGSANLTDKALGFSQGPNVELLLELRPVPNAAWVFLHFLEESSIEASEEIRREVESEAVKLRALCAGVRLSCASSSPDKVDWFPKLRQPSRLFAYYRSPNQGSRDERNSALKDLFEICVPDGLGESEFREHVRQFLFSLPYVAELDLFLHNSRRFGEVTDWLRKRRPDLPHRELQRIAQTLIRWLLYFAPDRYYLAQPRYTEVIGRRGCE